MYVGTDAAGEFAGVTEAQSPGKFHLKCQKSLNLQLAICCQHEIQTLFCHCLKC